MTKTIRKRNADEMRGKGRDEEGIWKEQKWNYGKRKSSIVKRLVFRPYTSCIERMISLFFSVASSDCRYVEDLKTGHDIICHIPSALYTS